jgi:hypothetical protein
MAGIPYFHNATLSSNRYLRSGVRVVDFALLEVPPEGGAWNNWGVYPTDFRRDIGAMVVVYEDGISHVIPVRPSFWSFDNEQDSRLRSWLGLPFNGTPLIQIPAGVPNAKPIGVVANSRDFALVYRPNDTGTFKYVMSYHEYNPTYRRFDSGFTTHFDTELLRSNVGLLTEYNESSSFPDRKTVFNHRSREGSLYLTQSIGFDNNYSISSDFPRWNAANISGSFGQVAGRYGAIALSGYTMKSDSGADLGSVYFWGASGSYSIKIGELKQPERIVMTQNYGAVVLNSDKSLAIYWDMGSFSPNAQPGLPWDTLFPASLPENERWKIDGSTIEDIFNPARHSHGPTFLLSKNDQYPHRRLAQFFIAVGSGNEGRFPYWGIVPASGSNFQDGFYIPSFGMNGAIWQSLTGVIEDNFEDAGPPGKLRAGTERPINVFLGESAVSKIYRGARLLYP